MVVSEPQLQQTRKICEWNSMDRNCEYLQGKLVHAVELKAWGEFNSEAWTSCGWIVKSVWTW